LLADGSSLAIVAALGIAGAVVGGIGGFGTGIILTAGLAPLIGVKNVIPVMTVASAIINIGRFWFYRSSLETGKLAIVLACAAPFLVIGVWIYSALDARAIGTMLGIVVIASVPVRRTLKRHAIALGNRGLAIGSGVFGLAHGVASGVGVIMVSLLLGTGMSGQAVLATDALISIVLDVCKAGLFQRFSLLSEEIVVAGIIVGVATIPGSAAAAWMVKRMHAHLHVLFMEGLILIGGASLLWNSWR
jgi:uncharacterized membrane protein YfcA